MSVRPPSEELAAFLRDGDVLQLSASELSVVLETLGTARSSPREALQKTFEWVRDEIGHSVDRRATRLTCSARDVLRAGHGLCFAKCHLLVALLRAQGIAAGFGYQRLRVREAPSGFGLHGFVWVHVAEQDRFAALDPRGNNGRVHTVFDLDTPSLAFVPDPAKGEATSSEVWPEPSPAVVRLLQSGRTVAEALAALPDAP